ncbi:recombination-associated protein RdgC [Chromobacterium vaccinii]|uniref:recombination-associated protein RdgC n=1 Tax=Chromobacterium vaccinii TaxID=1108595 RepID=UPI003C70C22A
MWFKQLSFYRLADVVDQAALTAALERRPFQPCMGLDWFSEGWVPPAGHLDAPVYAGRGSLLVSLRREDKVLPASVIRDFVDMKVQEIEDKELRKVGRKEKLALKEQLTDDLLPRAFVRSGRTLAYIDNNRQWLMVESATASKAEALVSKLREALPPFPAALPRTQLAPHAAMTDWLAAGEAPGGFELDADAVLRDSSENGAQVRVSRIDLTADEIRQHIATGKHASMLGLIWNEKIRFQLTDSLQLKRIQFLDVLQEEASQAGDDRESLFAATFLLMSEELGELVSALVEALGGLEDSQQHKEAA